MAPIDVDPQVFFSASASTLFSSQNIGSAMDTLKNALAGSAGMAGSDNTGQEFGGGYDQSANDVLTCMAGLIDMTANAADLLRASGLNHQAANQASAGKGAAPLDAISVPERQTTAAPTAPSAYGNGGNEPTGPIATAWHYIQKWVGYIWPNGNPLKLEEIARAWNAAATALRNCGTPLGQANEKLATQQSPEIPIATEYLTDLKAKFDSAAWACNGLETACNDLAKSIKDAHTELIDELSEFAAEFVVGEIVFAALFEVGGELWGNALMAARASVIAQRCAKIIEKLIELGRAAARAAQAATKAIAGLVKSMKEIVAAAVTKVPRVEREAARLTDVAARYHSVLDKIAAKMRTTSVLSTKEGTDIIASGGVDLSKAQRALAEDGQILAKMPKAHAEVTAIEQARLSGLTPRQIVATRPLCPECRQAVINSGGTVLPDGLGAVWP